MRVIIPYLSTTWNAPPVGLNKNRFRDLLMGCQSRLWTIAFIWRGIAGEPGLESGPLWFETRGCGLIWPVREGQLCTGSLLGSTCSLKTHARPNYTRRHLFGVPQVALAAGVGVLVPCPHILDHSNHWMSQSSVGVVPQTWTMPWNRQYLAWGPSIPQKEINSLIVINLPRQYNRHRPGYSRKKLLQNLKSGRWALLMAHWCIDQLTDHRNFQL